MSQGSSDRESRLREALAECGGCWNDTWDGLLDLDPDFAEALTRFLGQPWKSDGLDRKTKEFVCITVDAAATHLYAPGVRHHIRQALAYGATAQEVMEVLELTATLGIHACNIGVPILLEELEAAGHTVSREMSERQLEVKADFERKRGYWNAFWDEMLLMDAEFFDAYTQFSSVPWVSGTLEPKVKELIYTAFDVSATHLYAPGLRAHVRNALAYGATPQEVLEVYQLATAIGEHSLALGVPILLDELAASSAPASESRNR